MNTAGFQSLHEWLEYIETCHPGTIELGLERIGGVFERMSLGLPPCPVVTVAGTNGKGSSVALLEAIFRHGGFRVASYTSPHLQCFNERVRIDGAPVGDTALCQAFARVEQARGQCRLTYFEFTTLAALDLIYQVLPDVIVLEVGLGGRLDAVNIVDADVALITSIDIDHRQWLGDDRESIAMEKAGICRAGRPAVCSDPQPPAALSAHAEALGAPLYRLGRDFTVLRAEGGSGWSWQGPRRRLSDLPPPSLAGDHQYDNAAGVLMVLELLAGRLAVSDTAIRQGLQAAVLAGRYQRIAGSPSVIVDVAHNPAAARALAANLAEDPIGGRTLAVFGLLADKDIVGFVQALLPEVDEWFVVGTEEQGARGMGAGPIVEVLRSLQVPAAVHGCTSVAEGLRLALAAATAGDRIVVSGSFVTVGAALRYFAIG